MAGTRKKVYTDKKEFDKANQAYNDSLKLYNTTPWEAKNFMSIPNSNQSDWFNQFAKDKIKPVGIHNDSDGIPLYKKPTTQPVLQKTKKKVEPYQPKSQEDFDYRNNMYNDSLKLYNKSKEDIKGLKNIEFIPSSSKGLAFGYIAKGTDDLGNKVSGKIKPSGIYYGTRSSDNEDPISYAYKKPVQQISPYIESTDNKIVNDFNKGTGAIIQKTKPLSEEEQYQTWRSKLPKNLQYEGDYDLRGFWKENPTWTPDNKDVHMTDKFKLPNHKTFSNESKYYKPGMKAVKWVNDQPVPIQTQKYSASKYLELQGKPSGYINEGNKKGRVEVKANGGWLDKFEDGGLLNEPTEPQILPKDSVQYNNAYNSPSNQGRAGFNTEKDYLNNWFSSQRFKNKIGTADPNSVSNEAVNKVKTSKLFYNPNDTKGSIESYVDMHTNTSKRDKKELLKHRAVGKSYKDSNDAIITKVEGQNNPNSISIHELTHLTGLDELNRNKFKGTLYQDKYGNTVPFNRGEAYPSLMQFRYDNNFKPDQVITPEDMENIRNSGYRNILYDKYTDDEILNYLNTVADNSTPNPNQMAKGGLLKRADGSYSQRGLWDNIRANKGSGKAPTKQMLEQERKIKNKYEEGGWVNGLDNKVKFKNGGTTSNTPVNTAVQDNTSVRVQKPNYKIIQPGTYYDSGINKGTLEATPKKSIREKLIKGIENNVKGSVPLKLITAPVEAGLKLMRPDKYFENVTDDSSLKNAFLNLGLDAATVVPIGAGLKKVSPALINSAKNLEREVTIRALNSKPVVNLREKVLNKINEQAAKSGSTFDPKNLKEFENQGIIHGDEGTLMSNAAGDLFNTTSGSGQLRKYIKNRITNKKVFDSNQELAKFYSPNRKFYASVTVPNKDYPIGELRDFNFFDDNPLSAGRTAKHLDNLSTKLPGEWFINPGNLSGDSYPMWLKILEKKYGSQYKITGTNDLILNDLGKHSSLSKLEKQLKFAKTAEEKELIKSSIEKELDQMHSKFSKNSTLTQEGITNKDPYIKGYNLTLHKKYKQGGWLDNLK
jgi:hypothetical protein